MRRDRLNVAKGVVVVLLLLALVPPSAASEPPGTPKRISMGPVKVGPGQRFHINVAYSPPRRADGSASPALRFRLEFELYVESSPPSRDPAVRLTLVERRSSEFILVPGEAISIGSESVSGYSASHLSLLGPMDVELEHAGLTVTGDLTSQTDGTTTTIVQLRPCG
jgi:hypothetical protein